MPKLKDLTGKRFGRLRVIKRAGTNSYKKPTWECICDCGNTKIVAGPSLIKGYTRSCGCLRKESAAQITKTHGMRKTRFYNIWHAMKRRCQDRNNINYKYYGGRGISVCDRWQDFINFKEDMYESYKEHVEKYGENQTTLDRIDVDGDYTPENTRWVTYTTQNRNTHVRNDNKVGVKGVFRVNKSGKYQAYIKADKKQIHLGTYGNLNEAISARKNAEREFWVDIT